MRRTARLLTVCAVLVGVFAMHGLPAQACAGGTGTAMGVATSAAHNAMSEHGTPCVATLTPRGFDVSLVVLPLVETSMPPTRSPESWSRQDRGPPLSDLLSKLCVSRT